MYENTDNHKFKELKQMLLDRDSDESAEEVLTKFCERHGISLKDCRVYYDQLVKEGEIKPK